MGIKITIPIVIIPWGCDVGMKSGRSKNALGRLLAIIRWNRLLSVASEINGFLNMPKGSGYE